MSYKFYFTRILVIVLGCAALMGPWMSHPCQAEGFIRDAEIEDILNGYIEPLSKVAGLSPQSVKIRLIHSPRLNAFVMDAHNIYMFTGTLFHTQNSLQIKGIFAHELGHIAGGHLARLSNEAQQSKIKSLLGMALGAAAGLATQQPEVAGAMLMGSLSSLQRSIMAFQRQHEREADQLAFQFLEKTQQSAHGMLEFFQTFSKKQDLPENLIDPYWRTHPMTDDRIHSVEQYLKQSPHTAPTLDPSEEERFKRIRAKAIAFLHPPQTTYLHYPKNATTPDARYAHLIADYKLGKINEALVALDGLLSKSPKDPYLWDLKGQLLFESGQADAAITAYNKSLALLPHPLTKIALAHALIETKNGENNQKAIDLLEQAMTKEPRHLRGLKLLAIAYGHDQNLGMTALTLAKVAIVEGNRKQARAQLLRAQNHIHEGDAHWLQLEDLMQAIDKSRE